VQSIVWFAIHTLLYGGLQSALIIVGIFTQGFGTKYLDVFVIPPNIVKYMN
jgi:hypothetical protein